MRSSRKQSTPRPPKRGARKPKRRSLRHEVTFTPDDFTLGDGGRRLRLRRGGAATDRLGWPELPIATRRLALPAGAGAVSVRVVKEVWRPWRGTLRPAVAQAPRLAMKLERGGVDGPISPPIPPGLGTARDGFAAPSEVELAPEAAKLREVAFPTAELRHVDHVAGNAVAGLRIAPVRWEPRTGRARYLAKATLEVSWSDGGAAARELPPHVALEELRRLLPEVDNPRDVTRWLDVPDGFDVPDICPDDPRLTRPRKPGLIEYPIWDRGRPYLPPDIIFRPREDWPYVIVTDEVRWAEDGTRGDAVPGLVAAFRRLADWKSAKGVRARVVTITDILANRFGRHWVAGTTRDVQEAIRNFLQHAHARWNTRWCLLGGDIDIVPVRHVLGDWGGRIVITATTPPPAGEANHTAGTTVTHYHAPFVFATSQLLFARAAGTLGYRAGATPAAPGWYFATDSTFATASATPTEWVVVRAPAALLDGELLPPRYGNLIPTDLYYASIDGPLYRQTGKHDWDLDGNGLYGWVGDGNLDGVDWGCDLSVGRAPVDSAGDAGTFVDKVLTYETFRDVRTGKLLDGEYPRRYLGVGDVWGSNWWDGTLDKASDAGMDGASEEKNVALATLRDAGVEVDHSQRLLTDLFFDQRIATDLAPLAVPALRDATDAGPHFVSVSGHGWWGGCCGLSSNDLGYADARAMRNWPSLGIYFVDSCLTNEIDVDKWRPAGEGAPAVGAVCLGKRIIRVADGGAVGYVGYSRVGAVGYTQEQPFWSTLATPGQRHLGRMHDRAREVGATRVFAWQIFVMNLNGDPELRVWTDAPHRLTVSHTATVYGQDRLTVSVLREGAPVLDATVCVSQIAADGDVTYFALAEAAAGHYTFDTAAASDGQLTVVVTGDNVIPHVAAVDKVSLPVSPHKARTGAVVYDVAVAGTAVLAARGDGRLGKLDGNLTPVWTAVVRTDGKPLVDVAPAADGSAVVATRDDGGNNLHLVTAAGAIERSWALGRRAVRVARSGDGNTIYVATHDTGLKALARATGASLWSTLKHAFYVALGPSNRIYVAGDDTDGKPVVVCLDSDGSRRWTYVVGGDWTFQARAFAVHGDGRCVVGTRNRELHAISAAGAQLWKQTGLGASVVSLVIAGDHALAGRGDGVVTRAALADGAAAWTVDIGDRADVLLAAVDRVYVGTWHGVRALDVTSGATAWFRETQGGVLSLARQGDRLYAGARDGWVYRIDDPRRILVIRPDLDDILRAGTVFVPPFELWPGIRKPPVPPGPVPPGPVPRPGSRRPVARPVARSRPRRG